MELLVLTTSPPAVTAHRTTAPLTERIPRPMRADIQGLRALAVGLVVLYHLWPDRLTGGFVGVDVFFVISGFLITTHLYGRPPRAWGDVIDFWARRVRRLLPAALLVLTVTLLATRLVAPETQWRTTAHEAIAAALYVENWQLAGTSVDYLAAENAASPVQHFWSLSVEEQFYLFWPLLMAVLVAVAARLGLRQAPVVAAGLGAVVLASLAYSVHATAVEPASAYFITPTRVWELGVGALLAVLLAARTDDRHPGTARGRAALAWVGLAAILLAGTTYSSATPFPGWQAALPVLGTAAVIAARAQPGGGSPIRLLTPRPVQALGDISYSVYLWHWPLIVLAPFVSGGRLGLLDKAAILVASVVLAWVTKVVVEDRFRAVRGPAEVGRSFRLAAVGMVVVVGLAVLQILEVARLEQRAQAEVAAALAGGDPCFGAAALAADAPGCPPAGEGEPVPAPALAANDKSEAYDRNCFSPAPFTEVRRCTFGDPRGDVSIALVGNSHAGHWLPALQAIGERRGWRITTFLASECTANRQAVEWDSSSKQSGCLRWAESVLAETAGDDYDLVVTSERNGRPAVGYTYAQSRPAWLAGYRDVVAEWQRVGTHVLVLHDTATPGATLSSVPDCLAEHPDTPMECSGPRDAWVPDDPLAQAAQEAGSERLSVVDLNDHLCDGAVCLPVVGGVTVYSDASHMTATFASTLARYLDPALVAAVDRALRDR